MAISSKFSHPIHVKIEDIDSLGLSISKYLELGQAFVVRRHELDYRLPAYLKDALRVDTWTERFEGSRGIRHYEIVREIDGKVILTGLTIWVYIDMKTGRPVSIPEWILDLYVPISAP